MAEISLARLYALRLAYLIVGGGLIYAKWPTLISHSTSWPLYEGVASSMFGALAVMALLGLRYPLQMLPFLLFELMWKIIWGSLVFLPVWQAGEVSDAMATVGVNCLVVLLLIPLIPWDYAFANYLRARGAPWRPNRRALAETARPAATVAQ